MTTYDVYHDATLVASGLTATTYRILGPNGTPISGSVSAVTAGGEGPKAGPAVATPTAPVGGGGGGPGPGLGGAGPRAAPSTPSGITVPSNLDSAGSAALQDWVSAQSNGSTLIFPSGAVFQQEAFGIDLSGKSNMTLWGYGATLHNYGGGSNIRSSAIFAGWGSPNALNNKVLGFAIKGGNPNGATHSCYTVGQESAMGLWLARGSTGWEVADNTITDQWGLGFYIGDDASGIYCQNLNFQHNAIARTGLSGLNVRNGIGLTFADNLMYDLGGSAFDMEDALGSETIHSIYFLRNVINRWCWDGGSPHAIAFDGNGGDFSDIRVQNTTFLGGSNGTYPKSYSDGVISAWGPTTAKSNFLIDANDFSAIMASLPSGSWATRFNGVAGLTITNNNAPGAGELAHKVSCTSVTQTGNNPA